jgi:hypothetical protein
MLLEGCVGCHVSESRLSEWGTRAVWEGQTQIPFGNDKGKGAQKRMMRGDYSVQRLKTREPLVPPKPKELERA